MLPSLLSFLNHILDECNFVLRSTENKTADEFLEDEMLKRAVVRSLEIIGEATKKLDDDFKLTYPNVEWRKMAGTRDVLIHDYFGVDYEIVWNIITDKIPFLQEYIVFIIDDLQKTKSINSED